jgi:uncharacterized damage-inducible protein DinB
MTDVDERPRLADQLRRMHAGQAWHGPSLKEALDGVTAAMAIAQALPNAHTIYALVHHCTAWANEVYHRLHGRSPRQPEEGDFPAPVRALSEVEWAQALAKLDTAHARLIEATLSLDPALLDRRAGDEDSPSLGTGHTYYGMLHGLVQHDAYHAGQIVLLKRAMGVAR